VLRFSEETKSREGGLETTRSTAGAVAIEGKSNPLDTLKKIIGTNICGNDKESGPEVTFVT
jgi:hypothetical protein